MNASVLATGWHVPDEIIPNSFFDDGKPWYFYDGNGNRLPGKETLLTDEKIRAISGVLERRKCAPGEYGHHLVAKAATAALSRAGLCATDLDGIIVATVTAQTNFPSCATCVQELLGATNVRTAFDIANACAGFPLALDIAKHAVLATGQTYLVAGVETLTRIVDYAGRDVNANLFGDGAGVAIVGPGDRGILAYAGRSDTADGRLVFITRDGNGRVRMPNGPGVFRNAVRSMGRVTDELLGMMVWEKRDVDLYVYHQANQRILDGVASALALDPERVGNNIARYGNMSAAACPVLLAQSVEEGRVGPGSRVIMVSFGAGLVTSGVALRL